MGMAYHSAPAPARTGRMQECRDLKKQKRAAVRSKETTAAFFVYFCGGVIFRILSQPVSVLARWEISISVLPA